MAPNSVASDTTTIDLEDVEVIKEFNVLFEDCIEEMATFPAEQFQQILAAIYGNTRGGSFTQFTARFRGQRDRAKGNTGYMADWCEGQCTDI